MSSEPRTESVLRVRVEPRPAPRRSGHDEPLIVPMLRADGSWRAVSWTHALHHVAGALREVEARCGHGAWALVHAHGGAPGPLLDTEAFLASTLGEPALHGAVRGDADRVLEALEHRRLEAVWCVDAGVLHGRGDRDRIGALLGRVPLLVVQDPRRDPEALRLAHVLLPGPPPADSSAAPPRVGPAVRRA